MRGHRRVAGLILALVAPAALGPAPVPAQEAGAPRLAQEHLDGFELLDHGTGIWYYVREGAGEEVELEIRWTADGGAADTATEPIRTLEGPGAAGIHRVQEDLEREEPRPGSLGDAAPEEERRRVLPGTFRVCLVVRGDTPSRDLLRVEEGWEERLPGRMG